MDERKKAQLSKGLLDMKFMKRTKERVEKDADDAVGQALYSQELSESLEKKGEIMIVEVGISQCIPMIEGRFSFGGMNPAVEKRMEEDRKLRKEAQEKANEKDISDDEMAKQSSLPQNMANKFKKKKQRKFNKPTN